MDALPVLAWVALIVFVCAGVVWSGLLGGLGSQSGGGGDGFGLTGLIGCFGQGPGFSPAALMSGKTNAETAESGPAAALRAVLVQFPDLPASGWTIVSESDSRVMYLAPVANSNSFAEVTVEPGSPEPGGSGAGGWRSSGSGSCTPYAVPPSGYGAATWALDPSAPYSAGSTDLHILVDELSCHGFETAQGRIIQNVQYGPDAVVVTLAVREIGGTCPGTRATPYLLHLTGPVGSRNLEDGGPWPATLVAAGGSAVLWPSPTQYPTNWHMPMDCTGEADGPGSFKAASMSAKFQVYCAALPAGWRRESMSDYEQVVTSVNVAYRGPNGELFELAEGEICAGAQSVCAPSGTSLGTAMFGDREGQLVGGPPGADYALYVDPGRSPSWKATGKGMSLETFKALAAALIVVGK